MTLVQLDVHLNHDRMGAFDVALYFIGRALHTGIRMRQHVDV